jgi:prepilin-type N-terminal cleavage/methylation domain-containing protein
MKPPAMTPGYKFRRSSQSGFTLLEMLISVALLVILSGAILGGLGAVQKSYRGDEIRGSLNQEVRATMEMISQEIGQAGLPPTGLSGNSTYAGTGADGALATLSAAVTAGETTAVGVSDTTRLQAGMLVAVDTGAYAELLQITNVSSSAGTITVATVDNTAGFQKAHAYTTVGAALYPQGVYPMGISFKSPPTTASAFSSFSYQSLIMFGDITGTGTLSVVQYNCPIANSALTVGSTVAQFGNLATYEDTNSVQWGPLTRTIYNYSDSNGWTSSTANMLDLVRVATVPYLSQADGCRFDYNVYVPQTVAWYMTTSVNVTIIAESVRADPTTGNPEVVAKSFMNIQPRNILNAYNMYLYNTAYNNANPLTPINPYEEFNNMPTIVQTEIGNLAQ